MCVEKRKQEIKDLLQRISNYDSAKDKTGYYQDKKNIKSLFESTRNGLDESKIRIRLTVLDSMYSTQMRMRPYGLEDLTKAIWEKCHKNNGAKLKETLTAIAAGKELDNDDEAKEIYNLFCGKYGVEGNNAQAVSLISKYFYFETGYKFPIYDSIVREYLPILYKYCGSEIPRKKANEQNTDDIIKRYIKTINEFFTNVIRYYDEWRYDSLDHLLWVVGKILRGNLSLVLEASDYKKITERDEYKKIEPNKNKASSAFIENNISDYENYINKLISILNDGGSDKVLNKKIAEIALKMMHSKKIWKISK